MPNFCKNGLHFIKNAVLRVYLDDRCSIDEALGKRKITPKRFHKWLQEPLFLKLYTDARRTRALMAEKNPAPDPASLDQQINARAPAPAPAPLPDQAPDQPAGAGAGAPPATPPRPDSRDQSNASELSLSEREWVYSINGEEGLAAYDEFVKLNEQREAEQQRQLSKEGGAPAPDVP